MNDAASHLVLKPGIVLSGMYQIIRLIGRGGMGAVYMAYDMRLDMKVAIKVISPELAETMDASQYDGVLRRFRSEARIAAKIDHPNVIRIFGFIQGVINIEGQDIEIDYLVMELLAGRTLRDTMDVSGFEYEAEIRSWLLKYIIPILEGLEKVHSCGIIHRDIKPENFFMKGDVPILADFGLSMGFDLPSVTGSVADIFGTMTYISPEQFYNFSLAREPADIFSIGRILFEVVEGTITEKVKAFKQVRLSRVDTDYLMELNEIVMAATAESTPERIRSARELKDRLLQLERKKAKNPIGVSTSKSVWKGRRSLLVVTVLLSIAVGALAMLLSHDIRELAPSNEAKTPLAVENVNFGTVPQNLKPAIKAKDNSVLHLIPPIELELTNGNPLGSKQISAGGFYLSESPVTNQQYITFLNANLNRIEVLDSDVLLDGRIVLKLSEKIRGYKPISYDGKRFQVLDPMHSACAVLMVTGHGSEAYSNHFGLRLLSSIEWFAVMLTSNTQGVARIPLPTPVINYPKDRYELRGINQLAEWGKDKSNDFIIMGQSPSEMIEATLIVEKDPLKYYTDTGFRVAMDVDSN